MAVSFDEDDELRGGAMPRESESDDGRRLVWAIVGLFGLLVMAYAGWLGYSVTTLQQEMAGITAKLDIVLADRHDSR